MTRYVGHVGRILELYHVIEDDGRVLSTIAILDPYRGAAEFAEALRLAAGWFFQASKKELAPSPEREP